MVLDLSTDTIKYQTTKSDISDELVQIEDDEDEDDDVFDVEQKRKQDALERENILMNCEEYANDILKYLREAELKLRPKANYLKQQQDITPSMRSVLVDWLVEVSEEYKLHTETLYLAVNYTDRFLSKMSVLRGKLQLLGTASMYIAR
jgi:cyclin A